MDITPPELSEKRLYSFTVSQEAHSTIYITTFRGADTPNGVYRFREGQKPLFTPLGETAYSPQIWRDELYYLELNCVKKLSLSSGAISLLAGTCGTSGYGFREGAGAHALFKDPTSLTLDATGRIYIADSRNHRIRKIENNEVSTYAGKWIATDHPTEGLNYSCEAGVCVAGTLHDPIDGILYFLTGEPAGKPIQPFIQANDLSKPGVPAKVLPIVQDGDRSRATFWRPGHLAFDALGNLYVRDHIAFQQHIRRISPDGHVITLVADTNRPDPNHNHDNLYPQALHTLDSLTEQDMPRSYTVSGTNLYVLSKHLYALNLDSGRWKIVLKQQDLGKFTQIDPQEESPVDIRGLSADSQGNLYVLLSQLSGLDGVKNKLLKIILPESE